VSGFTRRPRGGALLLLGVHEAALIATLASQLVELLRHDEPVEGAVAADPLASLVDLTGPVESPTDPVLARLLPDAYRDDAEAAADFRRYTERGLRSGKVDDACAVIESLRAAGLPADEPPVGVGELDVTLDDAAAQSWLRSLTDLRLALATRLGIEQDDDEVWAAMPEDDPRVHVHDIYAWLGYLQETLVQALSTRRR
jgi:hypothetical protein